MPTQYKEVSSYVKRKEDRELQNLAKNIDTMIYKNKSSNEMLDDENQHRPKRIVDPEYLDNVLATAKILEQNTHNYHKNQFIDKDLQDDKKTKTVVYKRIK